MKTRAGLSILAAALCGLLLRAADPPVSYPIALIEGAGGNCCNSGTTSKGYRSASRRSPMPCGSFGARCHGHSQGSRANHPGDLGDGRDAGALQHPREQRQLGTRRD